MMKALILIGGQGTRLRPLTLTTPKPLMPILGRPFIHHQLDLLRRHGVRDVVLCTAYQASAFREALSRSRGLKIRFVNEKSPLGTGGAVGNARRLLTSTTLVLNGDLLHELDISAFVRQHRRASASASIALIRVKDPTHFGLVHTDPQGKVLRFTEKPSWDEVTTNTVNAGAYLFEPKVLDLIPAGKPCSLERETFPALLASGMKLQSFLTKGYWIDIGTLDKYLQVHMDLLDGHAKRGPSAFRRKGAFLMAPGAVVGRHVSVEAGAVVALGRSAKVGDFATFPGSASIGDRCVIGRGASLGRCVVLSGTRVGEGASLDGCIIGRDCVLEPHVRVGQGKALGDGSVLRRFSAS